VVDAMVNDFANILTHQVTPQPPGKIALEAA